MYVFEQFPEILNVSPPPTYKLMLIFAGMRVQNFSHCYLGSGTNITYYCKFYKNV